MKRHLFFLLIIISSIQLSYAQCDNVTSSGVIAADQVVCADNPNPATIVNVQLPDGGSGDLEFLWISTTQDPNSATAVWYPIPGSTADSYDPDPISVTTYYRRCSRRSGCTEYIGESNIVTVEYAEECMDDCELFKVTVMSVSDADCGEENGSVNLSIVAGSSPFSYNLNGEILSELPESYAAGSYDLTVTDAAGCEDSVSFVIEGEENTLAVVGDVNNPVCQSANGGIDLTISGGSGNYTALWNDGSTEIDRTDLIDGTYTVTITDENGCSVEKSFVLTMAEGDFVLSLIVLNASCENADGAAELMIEGGLEPYIIKLNGDPVTEITNLSPGDYNIMVTDANGCSVSESFTILAENINLDLTVNTTDAICEGTGAANIEFTNGTAPYNIIINGEIADVDNTLPAGMYEVTVTDANGCTGSASFTINELESDIMIAGSTVNPMCASDSGSISLTISGGNGVISVLWGDGSTDTQRDNLGAGTYNVTATDENGCTANESFVLLTEGSDLDLSISLTDVSCNGANDGSAVTEITGGVEPYTLSLDGVELSEISNLPAGEYVAMVVDAMGCSVSVPFSISQAPLLIIDANVQNPSCGEDNGSIELILSGGTGSYTVIWDDNLSNDLIRNGLAAGTYSLSVKDANDCVVTSQFTLIAENSNLNTELTVTNISCNGDTDGSVEVNVINGMPPYFYTLNGAVVLDLNNLSAGNYILETTDISGCSVTDEFSILEPSAIEITATIVNPNCGSSNGSIGLEITGGTPNASGDYTISWNNGNGSGLSGGEYSLTVTDANGCTATDSYTLIEAGTDLDLTISTTPTNCSNSDDGTASVAVSGGTEPYTYSLNGMDISVLPTNYAAGNYILAVIDALGCSVESSFTIETQSAIELTASISNTSCAAGGSIDLMLTGGSSPYSFSWSNGAVTQNLSDVPAGEYFVTVTDANGCTNSNVEAYTISNDGGGNFSVSLSTSAVSCFGGMDGVATVVVEGGTEPYSYILNGMNLANLPTNFVAGDYSLSILDANGCSTDATFTISQPDAEISFSGVVQNMTCSSDTGGINLSVSGGTAPYSFLWSNNATSQNLTNVSFGTYSLTITDANGCSVNNNDAPFIITESAELSLSSGSNSTTCGENNGTIAITVSQGTPPYQIVWNDGLTDVVLRTDLAGGNYGVTVTDANGCSVSEDFSISSSVEFTVNITPLNASCNGMDDGQINMSFAGGTPPFVYILNGQSVDDLPNTLPSDDYQLQVFDALGCSSLVEFTVGEPDEIIYLAEITDASCPGDFVTVEFSEVQGGSGMYSYLWSDGVTTLNRDDLTSGTYFLTITDTNGCTAVSEPFVANVPDTILISADEGDFQNVSCSGESDGAVNITVSGGTAPYTYFWSNGATTEDIDNLAPGDYLLQLTDANGCMTLFLAVITNPEELNATSVVMDASCMMQDGIASIWPTGGTQPYFFSWDFGGTNAEETNLAPGLYKVTVSDFGGCEIEIDVEVDEMDCLQSETGDEFNFVMTELMPDLTSNSIEIHWMTEAEAVESFFIIQHSTDGDVFTDVTGLIQGQGATQSQNEYFNTCDNMQTGTHFFRIRYVDAFGNLRTSETMSTQLLPDNQSEFSMFPNPTSDEFRISFLIPLNASAKVQIVSAQAEILENFTAPAGTLHQRIDLRKYNPGVYFVVIEREGLRRLTKRIVKM